MKRQFRTVAGFDVLAICGGAITYQAWTDRYLPAVLCVLADHTGVITRWVPLEELALVNSEELS